MTKSALHAYTSTQAHDQWHDAASDGGVSVSALLEVIAPRLGFILDTDPDLITEARKTDAARRRRRRGPK